MLRRKRLELRFDTGSGAAVMRSEKKVPLLSCHQVCHLFFSLVTKFVTFFSCVSSHQACHLFFSSTSLQSLWPPSGDSRSLAPSPSSQEVAKRLLAAWRPGGRRSNHLHPHCFYNQLCQVVYFLPSTTLGCLWLLAWCNQRAEHQDPPLRWRRWLADCEFDNASVEHWSVRTRFCKLMSVIIVVMMTIVLIPGKSCSRGWGELRTAWLCLYASGFTANITHHPHQDYDQIELDQLDHPNQDYDQGEWSETWLSWRFRGVTADPRMWCRMQSKVGAILQLWIVQLCNCAIVQLCICAIVQLCKKRSLTISLCEKMINIVVAHKDCLQISVSFLYLDNIQFQISWVGSLHTGHSHLPQSLIFCWFNNYLSQGTHETDPGLKKRWTLCGHKKGYLPQFSK